MSIPIYPSEQEAGLELEISSQSSCKSYSAILSKDQLAKADNYYQDNHDKLIDASALTSDLALCHGILVTTNWNKNDDVFTPEQVWPARKSPLYKPANMDHQGSEDDPKNQIIGVIADSTPVDNNYSPIVDSPDLPLPDYYHLLVEIYLWERYWGKAVKKIKDGIAGGNMFISMECFFADFGYAIRLPNSNDVSLLLRTPDTAWLTKFLRVYKGPGVVKINGKEYQVGRWLRNLTFSGVGFVTKPGNPESILFEDFISNSKAHLIFHTDNIVDGVLNKKFDNLNHNCVLNSNQGKVSLWPM